MGCKVYSLGYEQRTINEFIQLLNNADVTILVDVRENAWSHKLDFRKNMFSSKLGQAGIQYFHIPEAGNPKSIRKKFIKPKTLLTKYHSYLKETNSGLKEIMKIIVDAKKMNRNVCLTCFEKDFSCCHRSIILTEIKIKMPSLIINHL